jgi:hypothetical protein
MSKTLKIVLIIIGASIILCGGAFGLGAHWLGANKDNLVNEGRAAMSDGSAFGMGSTSEACIEEALRRASTCEGILCGAQVELFAEGCFSAAPPTQAQCAGAPAATDIIQSTTWATQRCQSMGHRGNPHCPQILRTLQDRCQKQGGEQPSR